MILARLASLFGMLRSTVYFIFDVWSSREAFVANTAMGQAHCNELYHDHRDKVGTDLINRPARPQYGGKAHEHRQNREHHA